jgi:hypothetical protein
MRYQAIPHDDPPSAPQSSNTQTRNSDYYCIMDKIGRYNVVHRLQKRSLLVAINCVAALSIFFFGYDQ